MSVIICQEYNVYQSSDFAILSEDKVGGKKLCSKCEKILRDLFDLIMWLVHRR